jgi:hypothetical protein
LITKVSVAYADHYCTINNRENNRRRVMADSLTKAINREQKTREQAARLMDEWSKEDVDGAKPHQDG